MFGSVNRRHTVRGTTLTVALVLGSFATPPEGWAQTPAPAADTRAATIVAAEQAKSKELKPLQRGKGEAIFKKVEEAFVTGNLHWHPFFSSAYNGGGFTLGAGYARHVSSYNLIDVRGSYTVKGYKRFEAEFRAPRLFDRRATLSLLGGWREATQVGFYGFGTGNTSNDDRANYSFEQPYGSANLELRPTRRILLFGAGVRVRAVEAGTGVRGGAIGRGGLHARYAGRARRRSDVLPRDRNGRLRLAHVAGLLAHAAATTAPRTTITPTRMTSSGSARWTTRRSSTSRSAAISGCCRSTDWRRPPI